MMFCSSDSDEDAASSMEIDLSLLHDVDSTTVELAHILAAAERAAAAQEMDLHGTTLLQTASELLDGSAMTELEKLLSMDLLPRHPVSGKFVPCTARCVKSKCQCLATLFMADPGYVLRVRHEALRLRAQTLALFKKGTSKTATYGAGTSDKLSKRAIAITPAASDAQASRKLARTHTASERGGLRAANSTGAVPGTAPYAPSAMPAPSIGGDASDALGAAPSTSAPDDDDRTTRPSANPATTAKIAGEQREHFACTVALQRLVRDGTGSVPGVCMHGLYWLTATSHSYWYHAPRGVGLSRLAELGMLQYSQRTLERTGLPTYAQLRHSVCPCGGLCETIALDVLTKRYEELSRCRDIKEENGLIIRLMWTPLGRPSGVCRAFLARWMGVPEPRIRDLQYLLSVVAQYDIDVQSGMAFVELVKSALGEDGDSDARQGSSANKKSPAILALLSIHVNLYTRDDPTKPFRKFVRADVNGLNALYAQLLKDHPELASDISFSTFRRMVIQLNSAEGLLGLQTIQNDHNVDRIEKAVDYEIDRAHHDEMQCRLDGDLGNAEKFKQRKSALLEALRAHRHRRHRIREFEQELLAFARALFVIEKQRQLMRGEAAVCAVTSDELSAPFRSKNLIAVVHTDDKTASNLPEFTLKPMGMALERYIYGVHGSYDMVRQRMHFYFPEMGCGSKNGSMVIDSMLLSFIEFTNGERVLVRMLDCASLNQNSYVLFALPQVRR